MNSVVIFFVPSVASQRDFEAMLRELFRSVEIDDSRSGQYKPS